MRRDQSEQLVRLEPAALRNDLLRRGGDVRQDVHAGAVRHRRGVDDAVPRRDGIDIDEVAGRHGQQIAVAEHRPFRPAGGAAGIKQPGRVLGRAGCERRRIAAISLRYSPLSTAITALDQGAQGVTLRPSGEIVAGDAEPRARVRQDEGELARCSLAFTGTATQPPCQQANKASM